MRIVVAGMNHETHTFLPQATPLSQFSVSRGADVIEQARGTNTSMGGFIEVLAESSADIIPLAMSYGGVSGTVSDEAYLSLREDLLGSLRQLSGRYDGVLLALHGAMVSESVDSTETDLAEQVRRIIGPGVPLMIALDLHGNLDARLLEYADAICGYHESPHIDADETGRRTARLLMRALSGQTSLFTALRKPGLVIPSVFSATGIPPALSVMDRVRKWQMQPGVLDVSFFFGFAWSDVAQLGAAAVAVAESQELAEKAAGDISGLAWSLREPLTHSPDIHSVAEGVRLAINRSAGAARPLVILDHSDRLNDTTFVLRELISQRAERAAHPLLCDPVAAAACLEAGAGSRVRLSVGSRSSPEAGGPLEIEGEVLWAGPKTYIGSGPMTRGKAVDLGITAIVQTGGVWLQITSEMHSLIDTDPITVFGRDPSEFSIIVTKSKTHFRAVYAELAEEIIIVDAPMYSPVDLSAFSYQRAPQSLYPFRKNV